MKRSQDWSEAFLDSSKVKFYQNYSTKGSYDLLEAFQGKFKQGLD